jgi:hypothetical protein
MVYLMIAVILVTPLLGIGVLVGIAYAAFRDSRIR